MTRQPSERARFEVLLEEVRDHVRTLAEGHSLLDAKMDRLGQRFDRLEQRVGTLETVVAAGFRDVRQRLLPMETAISQLDHRLIVHEQLHHN